MTAVEVDELLLVLRRHGVTSFASGDVRIELGPAPREVAAPAVAPSPPAEPDPKDRAAQIADLLFAHEAS